MPAMDKTASVVKEYDQLRRRLAGCGYISQGSVLDRSTLRSPRHGYQWTRKVAGKTLTVALSKEEYEALRGAVENHRQLRATLQKMETLSRRILFKNLPNPRRRKTVNRKVLGTI